MTSRVLAPLSFLLLAATLHADFFVTAVADGLREATNEVKVLALGGFTTLDGRTNEECRLYALRLASELQTRKLFSLVDRARLDKVLQEQALGATGLVDPSNAVEIGRLLQAEGILSAQIAELPQGTEFFVSLVRVKDGRTVHARVYRDFEEKTASPRPAGANQPQAVRIQSGPDPRKIGDEYRRANAGELEAMARFRSELDMGSPEANRRFLQASAALDRICEDAATFAFLTHLPPLQKKLRPRFDAILDRTEPLVAEARRTPRKVETVVEFVKLAEGVFARPAPGGSLEERIERRLGFLQSKLKEPRAEGDHRAEQGGERGRPENGRRPLRR